MVVCKKCHDWTKCEHARFLTGKCEKCGKENTCCAVCNEKNPVVPIPEKKAA